MNNEKACNDCGDNRLVIYNQAVRWAPYWKVESIGRMLMAFESYRLFVFCFNSGPGIAPVVYHLDSPRLLAQCCRLILQSASILTHGTDMSRQSSGTLHCAKRYLMDPKSTYPAG